MSELSDLFQKDPLAWSAADLELAIGWYQRHRDQFHLVKPDGELKKPRKPRKAKAKAKPKADPRQIDLEELIASANNR